MVTPTSLNGAYWALAVPAASVDATKSPAITALMNPSLMRCSPLSAERLGSWHMCGGLSRPAVRWPTLPHRRGESRRAAEPRGLSPTEGSPSCVICPAHLFGGQQPAKRGDVGGNRVEKRQHMRG